MREADIASRYRHSLARTGAARWQTPSERKFTLRTRGALALRFRKEPASGTAAVNGTSALTISIKPARQQTGSRRAPKHSYETVISTRSAHIPVAESRSHRARRRPARRVTLQTRSTTTNKVIPACRPPKPRTKPNHGAAVGNRLTAAPKGYRGASLSI